MEAIRSPIIWAVLTLFSYAKFYTGALVALIPYFIHLIFHGYNSLDSFVDLFTFLERLPLGLDVYSGIVSLYAPYTGSIRPKVIKFDGITCEAIMKDRPWLRNPFRSVHAVALTNLGVLSLMSFFLAF
jgi:hypothetical protein